MTSTITWAVVEGGSNYECRVQIVCFAFGNSEMHYGADQYYKRLKQLQYIDLFDKTPLQGYQDRSSQRLRAIPNPKISGQGNWKTSMVVNHQIVPLTSPQAYLVVVVSIERQDLPGSWRELAGDGDRQVKPSGWQGLKGVQD